MILLETHFYNNKVSLYLRLTDYVHDKDKFQKILYSEYCICNVYSGNDLTINTDIFNSNINLIKQKIKKEFNINLDFEKFYIYLEKNHFDEYIESKDNNKYILNFIKNNKDLNIILKINNVKQFNDLFEDLKEEEYPNLRIKFEYIKRNYILYKDCVYMLKTMNEIINFVNKYNLSPLEKIILVYDIVKANEYNEEDSNEQSYVSRDLDAIINSGKIVCVGFSHLMAFILNSLDIKTYLMSLSYEDNTHRPHMRNYINLKDEKYNIDGIFFLDVTWDSKKDEQYLDDYLYFLRPFYFFKTLNSTEHIDHPHQLKLLEYTEDEFDMALEYDSLFNSDYILEYSSDIMKLKNTDINYENELEYFFDMPQYTREELINEFSKIRKKYNQEIPIEAFNRALYKVRKIEYINGIIKKELIKDDLDNTSIDYQYFPWDIWVNKTDKNLTSDNDLNKGLELFNEFSVKSNIDNDIENSLTLNDELKLSKANTIEEDLLRMKLLKTLKEKINDIPDNDYIKKM